MSDLERIGVSLDKTLLESFDRLIAGRGYPNRSEAIRDLIRERLVQQEWGDETAESVATVSIVYDHHSMELPRKLADIQHDRFLTVVSSIHFHLDHHNCLEIIVLRGPTGQLRRLADQITTLKGVKLGQVNYLSTGKALK
jgi:CopG family nickel-responsive transcriptional regulator